MQAVHGKPGFQAGLQREKGGVRDAGDSWSGPVQKDFYAAAEAASDMDPIAEIIFLKDVTKIVT